MQLHFTLSDRRILKHMVSKLYSISATENTLILMSHAGLNWITVKHEIFLLQCQVQYDNYIYGTSISNMKFM